MLELSASNNVADVCIQGGARKKSSSRLVSISCLLAAFACRSVMRSAVDSSEGAVPSMCFQRRGTNSILTSCLFALVFVELKKY